MNPSGSVRPSPRTLEVESLASFDRLVAAGAVAMHGWHAQSLDLRGRTAALETLDVEGAIFLGCTFDPGNGTGWTLRLPRRCTTTPSETPSTSWSAPMRPPG